MLTDREKAVAILMLYAGKDMPHRDAVQACREIGIQKNMMIEAVRDLEQFRVELSKSL